VSGISLTKKEICALHWKKNAAQSLQVDTVAKQYEQDSVQTFATKPQIDPADPTCQHPARSYNNTEGASVAEPCRKHGMSDALFYKWRYGGLEVSEAKRLRVLEEESTELKRLLAEAMLKHWSWFKRSSLTEDRDSEASRANLVIWLVNDGLDWRRPFGLRQKPTQKNQRNRTNRGQPDKPQSITKSCTQRTRKPRY
jgi:hypothetical protein